MERPRACAMEPCARTRDAHDIRHWLCRVHRHRRGRRTREATEGGLLARLMFDFPPTLACSYEEMSDRMVFVCNAWNSVDMVQYVMDAYMVPDQRLVPLSYTDVHGLLFSFVSFVSRHLDACPGLRSACEDRVRCWYPLLVSPASRASMLHGERMLHVLERATGSRDFLVLADVVLALGARLGDAAELVYAAYVRELRGKRNGIMIGSLYIPYPSPQMTTPSRVVRRAT